MRKATMCLLMLLCSLPAFGQNQRQWKVVRHRAVAGLTVKIPLTTLFTPTKPGFYRLCAYISSTGGIKTWQLDWQWTDIAGTLLEGSIVGGNPSQVVFLLVPKGGTPVVYSTEGQGGSYNIVYTIEQLQ